MQLEFRLDPMFQSDLRRDLRILPPLLAILMEDLIQDMINAYDADAEALEKGRPALAKLRLLTRVEEQTSKQSLQDSFIDAGGLGAIREWLRLLPDNSLPNLTLRTSLLLIVKKLLPSVTIENLKDSKIGFAIRDIIFHEDEIVSNRRVANEIAEYWLRQVFGRDNAHAFTKATDEEMRSVLTHKTSSIPNHEVEEPGDDDDELRSKRRTSAIAGLLKHGKDSTTFRVQPVSKVSRAAAAHSSGATERIGKAVQQRHVRKATGTAKVSVEGRGLH